MEQGVSAAFLATRRVALVLGVMLELARGRQTLALVQEHLTRLLAEL